MTTKLKRFAKAPSKSLYLKDAFRDRWPPFMRKVISPPLSVGWVLKEALLGRVRNPKLFQLLFRLKRLSVGYEGFIHEIQITDRYSTSSVGGIRNARPLNDPNMYKVEWGLIRGGVSRGWSGLEVVDIGPAEGYFTLEAARLGAQVTIIQTPGDFLPRLITLADYFEVRPHISVIEGYYPTVGRAPVVNADIVLCLGLLYHLYNLIDGLEPMVNSKATWVIEGMFLPDDHPMDESGMGRGFDPIRHQNKERICSRWLTGYLDQHGFDVRWLDEWQKFVERPGNFRYFPNAPWQVLTRKMLIATPRN